MNLHRSPSGSAADAGLPVEPVTGAEALDPGDVSDTLRLASAHRGSGHGQHR